MPNNGAKSIFLSILITIFVVSFLAYSENLLTYRFMLAIHQIEPPIVFTPISEANLSRTSIVIGSSGTSINIQIAPTYQYNEFRNLAAIVNRDNRSYSVIISVDEEAKVPSTWKYVMELRSYDGAKIVAVLDLTRRGETEFTIMAGEKLSIWIVTYIPEGSEIKPAATSLTLKYVLG
jgi:hypothetical protein